jgi:hypothetical protein
MDEEETIKAADRLAERRLPLLVEQVVQLFELMFVAQSTSVPHAWDTPVGVWR